jgi:hypothetical protein
MSVVAALAVTLVLVPAARADITLRCDFPKGGGTDIFVITGDTARVDNPNGVPSLYHVEETATQFKLIETAEMAAASASIGITDSTVVINRITGEIVLDGKFTPPVVGPTATIGHCTPANAKF